MSNFNRDQEIVKRFDSVAEIYADNYTNGSFVSYFFNQRLKMVFDLLENYDHATVLDVGCGPGIMADYCVKKKFEFFGVDISEKMIATCLNKFRDTNSTHFSVGKLQNLEFSDSFFDVVLCMGALEYIEVNEIDSAISEMVRVLKPNGLIVISLLNKKSFHEQDKRMWEFLLKKLARHQFQEHGEEIARLFDEKDFCTSLKLHQLVDVKSVFFGLNIFPYCLAERLPAKLRIILSRGVESFIKGRFKWPYTAFLVKARKDRGFC